MKATADAKAAADAQAAAEVKAASDNKATANAKVAAVAEAAAAAAVKAAADAKAAAGDKAAPALVGHGTAVAAWAMVPAGSPTPKGQQRGNLCCPSSHIRKASLEEKIETLNDQIQRMRQLLKPPRSCATTIHQGSRNLLRALRRNPERICSWAGRRQYCRGGLRELLWFHPQTSISNRCRTLQES